MDELQDVLGIIEAVASRKGNDKQRFLTANKDNQTLKEVLKAIYDPSITYGVTEITTSPSDQHEEVYGWPDIKAVLHQLATRELTGHAAARALSGLNDGLCANGSILLHKIILRSAQMGCGANTCSKVWPDIFPVFKAMLAHKFEDKRMKGTMFVQPKLDGVRVLALITASEIKGAEPEITFVSRSGKEFTTFDHLKGALAKIQGVSPIPLPLVLDGEVVSGSFNKTVGDVRRESEQATDAEYHIFDIVPMDEFYKGKSSLTYKDRKGQVEQFVKAFPVGSPIKGLQTYIANNPVEVQSICTTMMGRGLEGVIVKNPAGHYVNKRSFDWLKIKAEESADCEIVGAYYGEKGKQLENDLGGLIVNFNGVHVNVGGGYSLKRDGKSRSEFMELLQEDVGELGIQFCGTTDATREFTAATSTPKRILGRIIEVEYHEVTPDGSLRHPRYKRFRDTLEPGVKE